MLGVSLLAPAVLQSQERGNNNQKIIRDPAEYRAYNEAINMRDPVQRAAALEAFVHNYPDSVVKIEVLEHAMAAYQQSGNNAKLEATARRILAFQPNNVRALAIVTYLGRSNGTDHAEEVCSNAQKGLRELSQWQGPEGVPEGESHKLRAQMTAIFNGAAGFCALQAKDYNSARDYYVKALQINPNNMVDAYQLGITDLEMNPLDVDGFWYIAKAMNLSQAQGNGAASQGMESYAKEKYRAYHGSEDGWPQIARSAASQIAPPAGFAVDRVRTPAELAVLAVQKGDDLTISDLEFILKYRDASPANKEAADKVWQALRDKSRMKVSIKVISATRDMIEGAITDENQNANKADIRIVLQKAMSHPPIAGSVVEVTGVMTSYTPQPFMFVMGNGELPSAKPAAHTQLSADDIERLLQGGVTPKRAAELVKQRGVDFTLDGATESRLRQAGATDELLLAIAKAAVSN
jgi:tetratricopeptide (TPR) repeat protein